ncbi:SEL1-like repeat protein [Mannheimia sp. HC-2023]
MYYKGKGVRRDVSKAKQLFGQACDNGESKGCEAYSLLDKQGVR